MPITKGSNSARIALTLELLNIINEFAGKEDQNSGFWIMKRLLIHDKEFKEKIIQKYGNDTYETSLRRYSKTNLEQRRDKEMKKEATAMRKESDRKIKIWEIDQRLEDLKKRLAKEPHEGEATTATGYSLKSQIAELEDQKKQLERK